MHDSVVTICSKHWPAHGKENGTLVDLRLFDPKDRSATPRLTFRPDALRECGVPEVLIEAAATSNPPGCVLFEDAPPVNDKSQKQEKSMTSESLATAASGGPELSRQDIVEVAP